MLKWAHNPALRPNCQQNSFENKQNLEKTIQHPLWSERRVNGRRVEQVPKESCPPGRRRSLGSLLVAKQPITRKGQIGPHHLRSGVTRKPALGTAESRAPLAVPDDALDRNMKTMSLTRTDGLVMGRDASLLKESPLKRWLCKGTSGDVVLVIQR